MEQEQIIPCHQCENNRWSTVIDSFVFQCRTCGEIRERNLWKALPQNWKREEGSKESQGIETPKQPIRQECGCLHRNSQLFQACRDHYFGWELAKKKKDELYTKWIESKLKKEIQEERVTPEKPATPWVETTKTEENIQIGIVTPNE